jgi:hypothetical protein
MLQTGLLQTCLLQTGLLQGSESVRPRCDLSGAACRPSSRDAFLMTVLVGAKRFAHAGLLRGDQALHALLGMKRFPTDDTIRNLFRAVWHGRGPALLRADDRVADATPAAAPRGLHPGLDSTVFERYGQQEGSLKGHNPRRHGRPSHHPLTGGAE